MSEENTQCHDCGSPFTGDETFDIKQKDGSVYTVCDWCYYETYADNIKDEE